MNEIKLMHRDIKPENIMMGIGADSNIVHFIDFGLTRSIINSTTGKHIDFVRGKNLIGTCRYVSINAHLGLELSRRDDLLTLGHVLLYFYRGNLPWQHLKISKNSRNFKTLGKLK